MPEDAEEHEYHDYFRPHTEESRLTPNKIIRVPSKDKFRCPSCDALYPALSHGEKRKCYYCNLFMQLWGATLYIWEEEERKP